MSTLALASADTLQMRLYAMKSGKLEGREIRQVPMGPWKIAVPVQAESDLISGNEMTWWVRYGNVRAYASVGHKDGWLFVLDAEKLAGLTFTATLPRERIKELKPAVVAAYRWDEVKFWTPVSFNKPND